MRTEAELANALVSLHPAERLAEDPYLSRALALSFMVIGEVATKMPEDFRRGHPEIAWNEAKALRNRIAHGYRTIVPIVLINSAREDLPKLIQQIDALLKDLEA